MEHGRSQIADGEATKATEEPYIDKVEVARLLGRSPRSVARLMSRGLIPYYKFDARVSFRWSEVQAHLAEKFRVCRR